MSAVFEGLGVCGGIGIGKVHVVDRRRLAYPRYRIGDEHREEEARRFERALMVSAEQLEEFRRKASIANLRQVELLLEAHTMILQDVALRDATLTRIREEGKNAEWALKDTIRTLREHFDRLELEYFRERRRDVDSVGDRVLRNLVGAEVELLRNLHEDAIVVAYDMSPADTVMLAKYAAKGFVTEGGGPTSHTAILARALNIPCVLGVHGIMEAAGTGDEIIVDGDLGRVILDPSTAEGQKYRDRRSKIEAEERELLLDRDLPSVTLDGESVSLTGNIEVSSEIEAVLSHGGAGVGLYRTEFLTIEAPRVLSAEDHFAAYQRLTEKLGERELTIRTVDIGGDKLLRRRSDSSRGHSAVRLIPPTVNPALGLRAIRLSLRHESEFRAQLKGILLASISGSVRLLIPLVTQLEEVRRVRKVIEETKAELLSERRAFNPNLPVGIMIETPGAAMITDVLAREADFISIGTNDLIQYALAVDRDNDDVAYLYRPCHPGVLRLLRFICDAAARVNVPVNLCGEMAANPLFVPLLLGLGLRSFSMSPASISSVKRVVRRLSARACEELVERLLLLSTADEVEAALRQALREWAPDLRTRSDV